MDTVIHVVFPCVPLLVAVLSFQENSASSVSLDPLWDSKFINPKRSRRQMEALFGSVLSAVVASLCDEEDDILEKKHRMSSAGEQKKLSQTRRSNLDVSCIAMLTLGALAAAAGRLWHGIVKETVEPYLGNQISVCPMPLADDAARRSGVVPGIAPTDFDLKQHAAKERAKKEHQQLKKGSFYTEADLVFAEERKSSDETAEAATVWGSAIILCVSLDTDRDQIFVSSLTSP